MLIPASIATSSRRSPVTRLLPPYAGSPASSGVSRARREVRNFRTSSLFVMASTLRPSPQDEGGTDKPSHKPPHPPSVRGMVMELKLNNDVTMPALGLGVFQSPPEETTVA